MLKNVLAKARQLYRKRRFDQAIRLLESQIFRFRDSPEFYILLGSACLYHGDNSGAASYLKRAEQLNPKSVEVLLGLAAVELKRSEFEEAVKRWLKVLDLEPHNRAALRGLELVRGGMSPAEVTAMVDSGKLRRLFPPIPFNAAVLVWPILITTFIAVLLAGALYLLPRLLEKQPARPGVDAIALTAEHPPLINLNGDYSIILSEPEVEDAFERVRSYLLQYRDNLALREVNRILLSNASSYVKERARLLRSFVQEPDFSTLKDNFELQEVIQDPYLYEGCYVIWAGKAVNVRIEEAAMSFELLVGYQQEEELLGIVRVRLDFAADLASGDSVEILGRLQVNDPLGLRGISLHKLLGD